MDHDTSFPARYGVTELTSEIGKPDFSFEAEGASRLVSHALVVTPFVRQTWRGEFFGGRDDLTRLINTSDPDVLVVVMGGIGYVVAVERPAEYSLIPIRPVVDIVAATAAHVVVCAGLTSLAALGDNGEILWKSARLVADGLDEIRVAGTVVVVRGRDTEAHREIEMTLALETGELLDVVQQ